MRNLPPPAVLSVCPYRKCPIFRISPPPVVVICISPQGKSDSQGIPGIPASAADGGDWLARRNIPGSTEPSKHSVTRARSSISRARGMFRRVRRLARGGAGETFRQADPSKHSGVPPEMFRRLGVSRGHVLTGPRYHRRSIPAVADPHTDPSKQSVRRA